MNKKGKENVNNCTFQLEPEAEVGTVAGNVVAPEVRRRGRPEHGGLHVRLDLKCVWRRE